jgi:hypothetical protein
VAQEQIDRARAQQLERLRYQGNRLKISGDMR